MTSILIPKAGTKPTAYSIKWSGSVNSYKHYVYEWTHAFNKGPGNYIFCAIEENDTWAPVYIGETSDLSVGFDNHHKLECILGLGATHIHAHANNKGEQARLDEKEDLISTLDPICQYF